MPKIEDERGEQKLQHFKKKKTWLIEKAYNWCFYKTLYIFSVKFNKTIYTTATTFAILNILK